jgi:HAD superfamily hydrolase (TIGR01458 family)
MMKHNFKGIIFDINGVLEFKGRVYPGAVKLINCLRQKGIVIRILTNSTLKSRKYCAEQLNQMGFHVRESEVITASYATAKYLETLSPRSCWVMLKRAGLKEFRHFCHDTENPEYIVLGDYREGFNFHNMNKALKLLQRGSKFIVMISEIVDNSMGEVELTVGAYGKMLENAANVKATYIGKPSKFIFEMALKTMDIQRNAVLMVGDRVSSDIRGAKNAGIKSVLVKTGEFKESDLAGGVQPDYIIDSINDIKKLF